MSAMTTDLSGTWRDKPAYKFNDHDQAEYAAWLDTAMPDDKLADLAEFDRVFTVHPDGSVTHPENVHEPEVYHVNGERHPDDVEFGDDWTAWTVGMSGQDRYQGAVMHSSEQFRGSLARAVLKEPGTYVCCTVEVIPEWREMDDDEAEEYLAGRGWGLPANETRVRETEHGIEVSEDGEDPFPAGWIVLKRKATGYGIRLTAEVLTPDGSDTNSDGDEVLPGDGYAVVSGWWNPDWSFWEVDGDPGPEHAELYEPDEYDDVSFNHVRWLALRLRERLQGVEQFDGGSTVYSADGYSHPYDGRSIATAVHPFGFTPDEIERAVTLARSDERIAK